MYITVTDGCLSSDNGYVGVTNPPPVLNAALLPSQTPIGGLICRYYGLGKNPYTIESQNVLDAASAITLADSFGQLPVSHTVGDETWCPMDDNSATVVVFTYENRPNVDLWVKPNGCGFVANGFISVANAGVIVP